VHRVGAHLFLNTPAIDQTDDLGFGLVDDQMLRRRQRFADTRITIGRIAPVDAPLAHRIETAPPGAFLNQDAFVLGKDALHLQKHLLFRAGA